ncbi:hypothetical protein P7K49_030326 [Saguinus oedipus]|uniref:Uncharacterized protein n=1 Tax=Saguinus oedipus TaxID=9490 RepID=A0ABQ9U3W2_SAGOE|nr:hypothetical protein P7K49_030326 [Saguinus oedipus]
MLRLRTHVCAPSPPGASGTYALGTELAVVHFTATPTAGPMQMSGACSDQSSSGVQQPPVNGVTE